MFLLFACVGPIVGTPLATSALIEDVYIERWLPNWNVLTGEDAASGVPYQMRATILHLTYEKKEISLPHMTYTVISLF